MLNPKAFFNSRPDGHGVLQLPPEGRDGPRRFVPLQRTELSGHVTGPLAALTLIQTFALSDTIPGPIEARYRFPLPGDAAVTGVTVRFGDTVIQTELKERETAESDYASAKKSGRQAALVTRESPDVFTLAVTGIRQGQPVIVQTNYVQTAKPEGAGWSLRVPLTTSPRYVRADEASSRHAAGQPLALLRDPGHRFTLNLTIPDAERITSSTHAIQIEGEAVQLREGEVVPDRDCVISWRAKAADDRAALRLWTHTDPATEKAYFLALCAPPKFANAKKVPREVVLLVDHSGSMQGPKWEAADWAVERFLAGLTEHDSFALGLFHDSTKWFAERPRKATAENVREAVQFLKANRDQGGTQLGVALEQALDRPRASETPSRHVLILTDAEVSDSGRILRLADLESEKPNRRRISVLCIDAAPNAALASELAERGGGVSRFLTSSPDEDDVTTALDEVLADWSAPVLTGLALEVNRVGAEAVGRGVSLVVPGPLSAVDVGDLPAGRPVWVTGRAPLKGEPLHFKLRTGAEVVGEAAADPKSDRAELKALFGADRVRRLEYLTTGGVAGDKLRAELDRLGYDAASVGSEAVYAENATADLKALKALLVRESLSAGVPSSETAFVAVRSEAGQPVAGTVEVANGLPAGWSNRFEGGYGGGGPAGLFCACLAAPAISALPAGLTDSMLVEFDDLDDEDDGNTTTDFDPLERQRGINIGPSAPQSKHESRKMRKALPPPKPSVRARLGPPESALAPGAGVPPGAIITVKAGQHAPGDGAVLYDDASGPAAQLTALTVTFTDPAVTADALDPDLTLLLFVGDLAAPRARVKLADVLRLGGRRPLNVRRDANQPVRLTLEDPSGVWKGGVPALEVVLSWS